MVVPVPQNGSSTVSSVNENIRTSRIASSKGKGAALEPACVQHCIAGALQWISTDKLAYLLAGAHRASWGRVCYVSNLWRLNSVDQG